MTSLLVSTPPAQAQATFNPVTGTQGFAVVSAGDTTLVGSESEGAIAVGGNLTIGTDSAVTGNAYNVALNAPSTVIPPGDSNPVGLMVSGQVNWAASQPTGRISVLSNSSVKIGNTSNSTVHIVDQNNASVSTQVTAAGAAYNSTPRIDTEIHQPVASVESTAGLPDIPTLFTAFRQRSTDLGACATTVPVTDSQTGTLLPPGQIPSNVTRITITLAAGAQNVLNLSSADLAHITEITFAGATPSATSPLIVNITGNGTFNWTPPALAGVGSAQAPFILWNMPDVTTLNRLTGGNLGHAVEGTVYAPNATFTDFAGSAPENIEGDIIVASLIQAPTKTLGEYHALHFAANLDGCSTAPAEGLSLDKSVSPGTVTTAGQDVTYSFEVTNTGATQISAVHIDETHFTGTGTAPDAVCDVTTLAPAGLNGASTTCTATYTITPQDIAAGFVDNTAVAVGTGTTGTITSPPSSAAVTVVPAPTEGLSLDKTASPTTVSTAGQDVTYSFEVTNTGNTQITGIHITDNSTRTGSLGVPVCDETTLAPAGQDGDSTTCTATYTVTAADIANGFVDDTATAAGTGTTGTVTSNPSSATVTVVPPPAEGLGLDKSVSPDTVGPAGEDVTYSFAVINTGVTQISGVHIDETHFTGTGTLGDPVCDLTTLGPAGSATDSTTCTVTYTITPQDIAAGFVDNTAVAVGTGTTGTVTSPESSAAVTVEHPPAEGLGLDKTVSPTTVSTAGEDVMYSFEVTNTGETQISAVHVDETHFSGTGTLPDVVCDETTLAPAGQDGDSATCTATYTVTAADIAAGFIDNTAVAVGTGTTGTVTSPESSAAVTVVSAPAEGLGLDKTVSPDTVDTAGTEVTYSFAVINTGVTQISGVHIDETDFTGTGTLPDAVCAETTLGPAGSVTDSTTCTATYTITAQDIADGFVDNTAVAVGTGTTGTVTSPESSAAVTVTTAPAEGLGLDKTVSPTTVTKAGEDVTYSFAVLNTGQTQLTGIHINEIDFTGTGTLTDPVCAETTLAPVGQHGDSTTCTATYTITPADIAAGFVDNIAVAAGSDAAGHSVTSPESSAAVTVLHAPTEGLGLDKRVGPDTVSKAGDDVTYQFAVINTGEGTLTGIHIDETHFSGTGHLAAPVCGRTTLGPAGSATDSTMCTVRYTITEADIRARFVDNTAVAVGTGVTGTVTSPESSAVVTVTSAPPAPIRPTPPVEVPVTG